jgi:type III secretion protein W
LEKLLSAFRESGGNPAALKESLGRLGDATGRHAALMWLEGQLSEEPSLAETAKRERELLEAESAPAIQAGYNVHGVDAEAVGGAGEGRGLYARTIIGANDIAVVLDQILAKHGTADFSETVDFLMRAVGADLSAATPSTDTRELESMNTDLYHLRALANFTREFIGDIAKLRVDAGKTALPQAGVDALRILCKAKNERIVMLDSLSGALGLAGGADPEYDVHALTKAFGLAHTLPEKLFLDGDARQRVLTAAQRMLDAAIDLEETLLGEEE